MAACGDPYFNRGYEQPLRFEDYQDYGNYRGGNQGYWNDGPPAGMRYGNGRRRNRRRRPFEDRDLGGKCRSCYFAEWRVQKVACLYRMSMEMLGRTYRILELLVEYGILRS